MARRVAIAGAVLAVVGILLQVWSLRYLLGGQPADQVARLVSYLVGLLPILGLVCTTAGAVMLGLGLLHVLTGRPAVQENRPHLLGIGLGLVVLMTAVEVAIMWGPVVNLTAARSSEGLLELLLHGLHVIRLVGAVLIGAWLTGLMSGRGSGRRRQRVEPPLAPSRPF